MTTFQKIKQKAQLVVDAIIFYETKCAQNRSEEVLSEYRTNAAREIAELAQMISNAAKVTETITETK